jgi:hypothetical protein
VLYAGERRVFDCAAVTLPMDAPPLDPAPSVARGGTRWRRTAVVGVPALVAMGVLVVATVRGPIPLNLVVSGQDLKLTSNGGVVELPDGLTLYPSTIRMKNGGETRGVVIAGLPEAVLTKGLCISLVVKFPVVGTYTIRLHTSGETTAKEMKLDASGLQTGSTTLSASYADGQLRLPIAIGKDARQMAGAEEAPTGRFGIEAPGQGGLKALQASAPGAIISGTVKLEGVSAKLRPGSGVESGECY